MNENNQCAVCNRVYAQEHDFLTGTSRWRLCSQGHLWFNCTCGSTMLIKKGKFLWYSPEKAMSPEAKGVFNSLGNLKDLPHFPTSVMEIQQLLLKPDVEPKEVASHLRHEPLMAQQIMQIAENIRNTRNPENAKIKSLEHAIVYVGYRSLSDLIMTAALKIMPLPESGFDQERFWTESYLTGSVAEFIMHRLTLKLNPDEVFLAGSLCNLGKLLSAFCFPPLATKISRDVDNPAVLCTWRHAEATYSFPDHCILGEIASTLWGFPDHILQSTRHHHDVPSTRRQREPTLADVVAFANQMTHWILLRPHRMEYEIIRGFQEKTGLTEADVETLAHQLGDLHKKTATGANPLSSE